jgi:hypothetical protein
VANQLDPAVDIPGTDCDETLGTYQGVAKLGEVRLAIDRDGESVRVIDAPAVPARLQGQGRFWSRLTMNSGGWRQSSPSRFRRICEFSRYRIGWRVSKRLIAGWRMEELQGAGHSSPGVANEAAHQPGSLGT